MITLLTLVRDGRTCFSYHLLGSQTLPVTSVVSTLVVREHFLVRNL
uniref:Uncharacterized protein n=1 Tax=Rhizophora mucronata TaxID=61149 RepID=A0A2P2P542_RHIMU